MSKLLKPWIKQQVKCCMWKMTANTEIWFCSNMDLRTLPAFTALTSSVWPDVYLPHTDTNRASNRANNIPWVFLFNISLNLKLFKDVNENKRKICIKVLIFPVCLYKPFLRVGGIPVTSHPLHFIVFILKTSLRYGWVFHVLFSEKRFLSFFLSISFSLFFFLYRNNHNAAYCTMLVIFCTQDRFRKYERQKIRLNY